MLEMGNDLTVFLYLYVRIQALPWVKESVAGPRAVPEPGEQPAGWVTPRRKQWHP